MHWKSPRLLKAAQWLRGRHNNKNTDCTHAETGNGLCDEEEEKRIRQWLLASRQPAPQLVPHIEQKQICTRRPINCEASTLSNRSKLQYTTPALQISDDANSQPFGVQSDLAKTNKQQHLQFRTIEEMPRLPKPSNLERPNGVVLYHPDFADWTTIEPAKDARSPSREQSRSSDLLQVVDDATAALSKLLGAPFAT